MKSGQWTKEENKQFLLGMKKYGKGASCRWRSISHNFVVTRTPTQVASHAQKYDLHRVPEEEIEEEEEVPAADLRSGPWTKEEHKQFLLGMKKYGKGASRRWRSISRNFVVTRTPQQVNNHAQKYHLHRVPEEEIEEEEEVPAHEAAPEAAEVPAPPAPPPKKQKMSAHACVASSSGGPAFEVVVVVNVTLLCAVECDKLRDESVDGRQARTRAREKRLVLRRGGRGSHMKYEAALLLCDDIRTFEAARAYVRTLGLKSQKDWKAWSKSGSRPPDIPSTPDRTYASSGWTSYPDFLGYADGKVAGSFRTFEAARAYVRTLGLKSKKEWEVWSKSSGARPHDIPSAPQKTYKSSGWTSYPDFLGYAEC
ncbi:hypothetical protein RI054_01g05780 [Pseudoscourfieldia marina]